jgi:hypothetical protein
MVVVVVGGCVVVVVGGWVVGGDVGCVIGGEVDLVTGGVVVAVEEFAVDVEVGVVVLGAVLPGVAGVAGGVVDDEVGEAAVLEIKAEDLPLGSTANQSFSTPCPEAWPFLSLMNV